MARRPLFDAFDAVRRDDGMLDETEGEGPTKYNW
jgi:hypothetical protein